MAGVAAALLTVAADDQAIAIAGGAVREVAGRLSRRLGAAPRHAGMV